MAGSPINKAVIRPDQVLWGSPRGAMAALIISGVSAGFTLSPLGLIAFIPLIALNTALTWRTPHISRHLGPLFWPNVTKSVWKEKGINVYMP